MDISSSTVFIAGGTSGIGLELARRLSSAGAAVVVGGRRTDPLEGIELVPIDVTDGRSVLEARDAVLAAHPDLDVVVTMAGVLPVEDLRDPAHFATSAETIEVNVLGTIRVIDAFTPHLIGRGDGRIITVSSGIGFLPFPLAPTYGASKAAVHAYSEALRAQLAGTGVGVSELVPPAVATTPEQRRINPHAVDLDAYVEDVLRLLASTPTPNEILVEAVLPLRWAERDGTYPQLLAQRSAALASLPGR